MLGFLDFGAFQSSIGNKHAIRGNAAKNDLELLGDGADKLYCPSLPRLHDQSFTKMTPQDIDPYAVLSKV